MKRGYVNLSFFAFIWLLLSTLVVPPIFKFFNRITPSVLGLPFVVFWILIICLLISLTLIVWYIVEDKRGDLE